MKRTFFRGRYYKHQSEEETICIIVGHASSGDFVQIITNDEVVRLPSLCGCNVSNKGIKLCYPNVKGELHYTNLKPLRTHIMGPFHYLPMQCSHEVVSMEHRVNGYIQINGRRYDFTEGKGYIEGDKGRSFPKEYLWLHSNAFEEDLSVMVSIAHIPFVGMSFTGCLCAIMYRGKEYRLATYRGVHVRKATPHLVILQQGKYHLVINIKPKNCYALDAPVAGNMSRSIYESNETYGRFRFYKGKKKIFDHYSKACSYECNLESIVR